MTYSSHQSLSPLAIAIRIHEAIFPALRNADLFEFVLKSPHSFWVSEDFVIASMVTPVFTTLEVWPFWDKFGDLQFPDDENKVLNLHRLPDGSYKLVSFQRGDWERDLLRYVCAPLGLLTIRPC